MKRTERDDGPRESPGEPSASARPAPPAPGAPRWTFLSHHAHVLLALATDPERRLRDVARDVGITERTAQRIVGELEEEGLVVRHRHGRRNHYELRLDRPLWHPIESHRNVGEMVDLISDDGPRK